METASTSERTEQDYINAMLISPDIYLDRIQEAKEEYMNTHLTFRALCNNNVWEAVEAITKGIERYLYSDWFKYNINTFGKQNGKVCYGCLATTTMFNLLDVNETPFVTKYQRFGLSRLDVIKSLSEERLQKAEIVVFESAVDLFRRGDVTLLNDYFDTNELPIVPKAEAWSFNHNPYQAPSFNLGETRKEYEEKVIRMMEHNLMLVKWYVKKYKPVS